MGYFRQPTQTALLSIDGTALAKVGPRSSRGCGRTPSAAASGLACLATVFGRWSPSWAWTTPPMVWCPYDGQFSVLSFVSSLFCLGQNDGMVVSLYFLSL
jgi:hypothetical protein